MTWTAATIAVGPAFCVVFDLAYCHREPPSVTKHKHPSVTVPIRYHDDLKTMYAWMYVCPQ